jgi:hypothetical protein
VRGNRGRREGEERARVAADRPVGCHHQPPAGCRRSPPSRSRPRRRECLAAAVAPTTGARCRVRLRLLPRPPPSSAAIIYASVFGVQSGRSDLFASAGQIRHLTDSVHHPARHRRAGLKCAQPPTPPYLMPYAGVPPPCISAPSRRDKILSLPWRSKPSLCSSCAFDHVLPWRSRSPAAAVRKSSGHRQGRTRRRRDVILPQPSPVFDNRCSTIVVMARVSLSLEYSILGNRSRRRLGYDPTALRVGPAAVVT